MVTLKVSNITGLNELIALRGTPYTQQRFTFCGEPNTPRLSEQMDAFWKGGTAADAMHQRIVDIKNKYPKP